MTHEPLSTSEPDTAIVTGYVRFAEALGVGVPPDTPAMDVASAAYDRVDASIRHGPAAEAWALVRAILAEAPDERLGVYAAGPLEDLVRRWGAELVDAVVAEAATDERFRWALGGIWLSEEDLPRSVLEPLVAASAGRLKVLEWLPERPATARD